MPRHSMRALLIAALLIAAVPAALAAADDEDDVGSEEAARIVEQAKREERAARAARGPPPHPLTDMPEELEDLEVVYVMPEAGNSDGRFPAGQAVDVMVGIRNSGEFDVNLTGILGSLNHNEDFNLYFQNFTGFAIGSVLRTGSEISVPFRFTPDKMLPPRAFQVALTLFYVGNSESFSTTFYNRTIDVIEESGIFNPEVLFMYVIMLLITAAVGYVAFEFAAQTATGKKMGLHKVKVSVPSTRSSGGAGSADDWLVGTSADKAKGAKKPVKRTGPKK